jgi:hypothetical protein
METEYRKLIISYYKDGVSLAGITSLLYYKGFSGMRYLELRKIIAKDLQRFVNGSIVL